MKRIILGAGLLSVASLLAGLWALSRDLKKLAGMSWAE